MDRKDEFQKIIKDLEEITNMMKNQSIDLQNKLDSNELNLDYLALLKALIPIWINGLGDLEDNLKKTLIRENNNI